MYIIIGQSSGSVSESVIIYRFRLRTIIFTVTTNAVSQHRIMLSFTTNVFFRLDSYKRRLLFNKLNDTEPNYVGSLSYRYSPTVVSYTVFDCQNKIFTSLKNKLNHRVPHNIIHLFIIQADGEGWFCPICSQAPSITSINYF